MSMSPRLLRPRATGFNPKSIPGLVGWWDAADLSTLNQNSNGTTSVSATNDPIGSWKDKSSSGNDIIQATANNRPVYDSAGTNGKPAVLFDGLNDVLRRTPSATIGSNAVTAISVYVLRNAGTFATPPIMLGSGPNPRPFERYHTTAQNYAFVGSSFTAASLGLRTQTIPFVYGVILTKDGASSGVHTFAEYANNVLYGPYSVTSTYSTASQVISVGARADSSTLMDGWVSEMLLIDGAASASVFAAATKYLASKWGVSL
jgi:hypothetical protein